MKAFRYCLALALIAAGVSVGSAHEPAGVTYFAFQFPLHAVPTVDGDLGDWAIVPDLFEISMENGDIVESARLDAGDDLSDFNMRSMIGWNEETNRVYAFADVVDNFLHNKREVANQYNWDDDWEFFIDADHSGGDMFNGDWNDLEEAEKRSLFYVTGQGYEIHVPPIDGYWAFTLIEHTNWLSTGRELPFPEFLEIGWNRTGESDGPGTYQYEIKVTPWGTFDWDGPAASTIVDLNVGTIIHVGYNTKDYDLVSDRYDGSYDFPPVHNVWRNASLHADIEMLEVDDSLFPTAVETNTWGRIKANFLLEE
jgi:hypothetical protein